jgi:hypothetical protein
MNVIRKRSGPGPLPAIALACALLAGAGLPVRAATVIFLPADAEEPAGDEARPAAEGCTEDQQNADGECETYAEASWNPTASCTGSSAEALIACLEADAGQDPCVSPSPPPSTIDEGGGGIQELEPAPSGGGSGESCPSDVPQYLITGIPDGLQILTADGGEIDDLRAVVRGPAVSRVTVGLNRPDRIGRIAEVGELPSSGVITIGLNNRKAAQVTTDGLGIEEVNGALYRRITDSGFTVVRRNGYFEVLADRIEQRGITHVEWESTDPGIVNKDLALAPGSLFLAAPERTTLPRLPRPGKGSIAPSSPQPLHKIERPAPAVPHP